MVWAGRGLKKNLVPLSTILLRFRSSLCADFRFFLFFLNIYFIFWSHLKAALLVWLYFPLGQIPGSPGLGWEILSESGHEPEHQNLEKRFYLVLLVLPRWEEKYGKKGCESWDIPTFSWNGVGRLSSALGSNQPLPRNIPCPAPAARGADFHFGTFYTTDFNLGLDLIAFSKERLVLI